ncbi:MAG: PhzF family phenazine biosynthesis protein [Ruminococcus sp.]|nr:PhzF family phenazine biosynthesis protein [Ruminococcus sp.]
MKQYIIDAFTDKIFSGNPAAVCITEYPLTEDLMLNIAKENNLSETAFALKAEDGYNLRWFTPGGEIDFCGHATLATAFVISEFIHKQYSEIIFHTKSGDFPVSIKYENIEMNFPAYSLNEISVTDEMQKAIGVKPVQAFIDRDMMLVLENEEQIRNLNPNFDKIKLLDGLGLCVTAKGKIFDCVSRFFAPKLNVNEDPVTGSTHCMIIPYWAERLGKNSINAYQASNRGGKIYGFLQDNRVIISGNAVLFGISDICLL